MKPVKLILFLSLIVLSSCAMLDSNEVVHKISFKGPAYSVETIGQEGKSTQEFFVLPDLSGKDFSEFLDSHIIENLTSHGVIIQIEGGNSRLTEENVERETYIQSITPLKVTCGDTVVIKIVNHSYAN